MRTKNLLTSAFIDQTCSAWPFPPSDAASFNTPSIIYSCTNFMSWKFSFPTIYQSGWYPNFATSPKSNRYGLSWPRMQPCSLVTFLLFFILPIFVASNEIVYITLCNGFSTFRRPSATACRSPNLFRLCFAAWLLNTLLKFATRRLDLIKHSFQHSLQTLYFRWNFHFSNSIICPRIEKSN